MDINLREVTSSAVLEEKKKLRREFKYLDMIFYTVAALIGLDTIGAFAANGTQALTWLVISAITFLFPYALLIAELGSTFTQEGGMYEWCKMAGGRFFAALAAMLYWVSNPLWLGGTLAVGAIAAIKAFWFGSLSYQFGGTAGIDATVEILIALFFIWGTIWCAILSLRVGKYISVFGSYLKLGLLVVFVLLSMLFLLGGHSKGTSLNAADLLTHRTRGNPTPPDRPARFNPAHHARRSLIAVRHEDGDEQHETEDHVHDHAGRDDRHALRNCLVLE